MFECKWEGCDRLFDTQTQRNRHSTKCREGPIFKEAPRFYCRACDRSFYLLECFNRHLRGQKHAMLCGGGIAPNHPCEFAGAGCEKRFLRAEHARRHARRCAHNPASLPAPEKITCPVENCGARINPRNLARHMGRMHKRPVYTCEVCMVSDDYLVRKQRNFYSIEALAKHKLIYHRK